MVMLFYTAIDKYNGKESTFYVDKSLLPELEKLNKFNKTSHLYLYFLLHSTTILFSR